MKARANVRSVPSPATGPMVAQRGAPAAVVPGAPKYKSWACLVIGEEIEVLRGGEVVCTGRVDDVSLNGNVLWVRPADPAQRQLFVAADAVRVRPRDSSDRWTDER